MDLNIIWFILVAVLIIGYAVLDGFDLGVGVLHLFARSEDERKINLNAIGPVWDGNEVWLLTGGGALFAAFPIVYATVFSGFYLALYLLLLALIMRAVSFEFRHQIDSERWQRAWDWMFGIGSLLPAILFGVAVGNILRGIPLNAAGDFTGSFFTLLNPYSVVIGLVSLTLFTMHGAIFMTMKTGGTFRDRMVKWGNGSWMAFMVLYTLATFWSFFAAHHLFDSVLGNPVFWLFFLMLLGGLIAIPMMLRSEQFGRAFVASSVTITSMIGLAGVSLFPRLVPSLTNPEFSLTIYNAASTPRTHLVMLIIALIGMPIVIGYTIFIYRQFRGQVSLTDSIY